MRCRAAEGTAAQRRPTHDYSAAAIDDNDDTDEVVRDDKILFYYYGAQYKRIKPHETATQQEADENRGEEDGQATAGRGPPTRRTRTRKRGITNHGEDQYCATSLRHTKDMQSSNDDDEDDTYEVVLDDKCYNDERTMPHKTVTKVT